MQLAEAARAQQGAAAAAAEAVQSREAAARLLAVKQAEVAKLEEKAATLQLLTAEAGAGHHLAGLQAEVALLPTLSAELGALLVLCNVEQLSSCSTVGGYAVTTGESLVTTGNLVSGVCAPTR